MHVPGRYTDDLDHVHATLHDGATTLTSAAASDNDKAQHMLKVEAVLAAAGSSLSQLITVRVYIANIGDWQEFNALYSSRLGAHKPARAVVPVPALHFGFKLEVEAMAAHSLQPADDAELKSAAEPEPLPFHCTLFSKAASE